MLPPSRGIFSNKLKAPSEALSKLVRRIDQLGRVSDEAIHLTRTFLSPAMRRANSLVGAWMVEAGLTVHEDQVGNLIGRLEGTSKKAKTLIVGSHLDTVRAAGRFDGALGVLIAISAVAELNKREIRLPFAVEVVGFSEEEGVRFSSAYLGSKGYTGTLTHEDLALRDDCGISAINAIESTLGRPETMISALRRAEDILGYFEVHIEQGPVLEAERCALGVVTGVAGQTRVRLAFIGKAGHAGTTPMPLRADALAGAAAFILETEKLARKQRGLVATVGAADVFPNAGNVIAGKVEISLDVRHLQDAARQAALVKLQTIAERISKDRSLKVTWEIRQEHSSVLCSSALSSVLKQSIASVQRKAISLPSGAGHDAVVLSKIAPVAMLFVRCRDGLSHHPDEYASPRDIEAALRVTIDFLQRLAKAH